VVSITMPPLRERPSDIAALAEHFIEKFSTANGLPKKALSQDALSQMMAHHWRGNVRELENTMHRAVLLARGTQIEADAVMLSGQSFAPAGSVGISPQSAAEKIAAAQSGGTLVGRTVADVERDLIIDTLNHCLGNRTHAANILGISIRTLRNKLKQYSETGAALQSEAAEERAVS
jgi:DNA-binding NtrC family response regulator